MNPQIISNKRVVISFSAIFFVGLGLRFFYFPHELPLISDAIDNFTFATSINFLGYLPVEWAPANNGWPIFLSFWFSIISLENSLDYMQMQRIISVILSALTIIPVYFLCRKFFDEKISLVGGALFAFDPRIIMNSVLGITEPLFIILGISSLVIFLKYGRKEIILSFILAALCTMVRSEGIFLLLTLSVLFFIKYRISKEIVKTYIPSLIIFLLILTPIMSIIWETGQTPFQRATGGTEQILSMTDNNQENKIIDGVGLFVKYLGWVMIPTFLIFVPFGFIQFLRNRKRETNFIIVFLVCSSIPILYAYIVQAQDTSYVYFLFPVFCLISLFAVRSYISKISRKNLLISVIIAGILVSSVLFYEYKKIDYEKEVEMNEIGRIISEKIQGTNFHPTETKYIRAAEVPDNWPFLLVDEMYEIHAVHTINHDNLQEFILENRDKLTHIIVDDNQDLPMFLQEVYSNEENYEYLKNEFNSKDIGFNHNVKLFKIDFELFDSIIED